MNDVKLLFLDLDGTLIDTVSGKTFAEDVTDFRIRLDVVNKIRDMVRESVLRGVCIVTNQGGIPKYVERIAFEAKLEAITRFIQTYCGVATYSNYCDSMDDTHPNRKPNPGMLKDVHDLCFPWVQPYEMMMVGDASGKADDFSDSDKCCAENYGIRYMDIDEFLK